jgi:hypothetical protein
MCVVLVILDFACCERNIIQAYSSSIFNEVF